MNDMSTQGQPLIYKNSFVALWLQCNKQTISVSMSKGAANLDGKSNTVNKHHRYNNDVTILPKTLG